MTTNRFTHQPRARRNALADAAVRLPAALLPTYPDEGPPRQHEGDIVASAASQMMSRTFPDPGASLVVRPWNKLGNPLRAARQMGRTRAAEVSSDEHFLDAAELLVSELVTNAVRHSDGAVSVEFPQALRLFVVRVLDESQQEPREYNATVDDVSGRGLALVRATTAAYGGEYAVEGKEVGKSMVCRLPAPVSRRREKTA